MLQSSSLTPAWEGYWQTICSVDQALCCFHFENKVHRAYPKRVRGWASWTALWKAYPDSSVFCFQFKIIQWENETLPQSVKETRCTYRLVYAEFLRSLEFLPQTENQRYHEFVGLQHQRKDSLRPLWTATFSTGFMPKARWVVNHGIIFQ